MASLPLFVVLKSNYIGGSCFELVGEEGQIRCLGKDVRSPLSKFSVERSDGGSPAVHFRSCYNNKYLVASSKRIDAAADEPEEDQSKSSCTLYLPVRKGDDADGYWFKHVNSGDYMKVGEQNFLFLGPVEADPSPNGLIIFIAVDWKTLVVLPQYIAFKGDNGNYLCGTSLEKHNYLKFNGSDEAVASAAYEVFPHPEGSIRLKSVHFGQFWRRSPNWIWADSSDTSTTDRDTRFWPVKIDDQTIALRNLGNEQFCQRLTLEGKESCLNAAATTINMSTHLQVTEIVHSREIYNVQFHPARARIYNEHVVVMGAGKADNPYDTASALDVRVVRTVSETKSWDASVSLKLGVTTTFVSKIPFIAEGKIEISAELSSDYSWGEVKTTTDEFETVYRVTVPARTRTTLSAVGTTATCDVPYSYTQVDQLMDGTRRTYDKDDGMYTGVNTFNVGYEQVNQSI